jgi:hypothetical protein
MNQAIGLVVRWRGYLMEHMGKLPKKYWTFLTITIISAILMFVNIFVFDYLTGEKEFRDYNLYDIVLNLIFLGKESLYVSLMVYFSIKCGKLVREKTMLQRNYFYDVAYSGLKPGDYDHVWFDFEDEKRALVIKDGDSYKLYVEKYNDASQNWEAVNTVSCHDSLDSLKKALYIDYEFYCDDNAEFDEHGEYELRENTVDNQLNKYEISDLCLLLSIGFHKNGSALDSILRNGDYLNHSIFTLDELNHGLSKLIFNGYVRKAGNPYLTTNKAKSFYQKYKKLFENPIDELLRLAYLFQYEPKKSGCTLKKYITQDEYNQAINKYKSN